MKNLFLTVALICCVSFAFANEGEDEKESPKIKETVEKDINPKEKVGFGWECFGLSCMTICGNVTGTPSNEAYVEFWYAANFYYCLNIV